MKAPSSHFVSLTEERLELVRTWRNKPRIRRNMLNEDDVAPEQQVAWFHALKGDATRRYLVYEQNRRPVGLLYFTSISRESCNLGYYLGDESLWPGSGLILQVAGLDYAFQRLRTERVIAEVFDFNSGPQRLHAICGFTLESRQAGVRRDGGAHDILRYSLMADSWARQRAEMISSLPKQIHSAIEVMSFEQTSTL